VSNQHIINELKRNNSVFKALLEGLDPDMVQFRPHSEHWTILEIISHLFDEEVEDFRQRLQIMLDTPHVMPPAIDPVGWVKSRAYIDNDFNQKLNTFIHARLESIHWLETLENPQWNNKCEHGTLGVMTAQKYLENWLAHDLLHIRQIIRVKYLYLSKNAQNSIAYAGTW